jgi:hypothetical protein
VIYKVNTKVSEDRKKADMLETQGNKDKSGEFRFYFCLTGIRLVPEEARNLRNTNGHRQKKNQWKLTLPHQKMKKRAT